MRGAAGVLLEMGLLGEKEVAGDPLEGNLALFGCVLLEVESFGGGDWEGVLEHGTEVGGD